MSLVDLDLQILQVFNANISPAFNTLVVILSYSIYAYVLVMAFYLYRKKDKKTFAHFLISAIAGFIAVYILKYAINRPRPYVSHPDIIHQLVQDSAPSFPSSHAFFAFLSMRFIPKNISKILKVFNILYLISIPLSVMYIGEHYPSDVVAGAMLGYVFPFLITEKISLKIWNFVVAKVPFLNKFLNTL